MKVIKNGKRNYGEFKFKCNKCGCKFEADVNDYIFVERDKDDWNVYYPTKNNIPSDAIRCECPNCGKKVVKGIYKRKSNVEDQKPFGYVVSGIFSIVLAILVLIAIPYETKVAIEFQIIVGVITFIYLVINSFVNIVTYTDE